MSNCCTPDPCCKPAEAPIDLCSGMPMTDAFANENATDAIIMAREYSVVSNGRTVRRCEMMRLSQQAFVDLVQQYADVDDAYAQMNPDGSITFTNVDGTQFTFNSSYFVDNGDGTFTVTNTDGTVFTIDPNPGGAYDGGPGIGISGTATAGDPLVISAQLCTLETIDQETVDAAGSVQVVGCVDGVQGLIDRGAAGSGLISVQHVTASGIWNKPAGVRHVRVRVQGAGGGGGSGNSGGAGQDGCSGGGGGFVEMWIDVSGITSATLTIGAAGAGAAATNNTPGGNGGASIWSDGVNTLTAGGGLGGAFGVSMGAANSPVMNGGSATGGDLNIPGCPGNSTRGNNGSVQGGNSQFGWGGIAGLTPGGTPGPGHDAVGYGAGGGGGTGGSTGAHRAGGSGTPGIIIVEEFA